MTVGECDFSGGGTPDVIMHADLSLLLMYHVRMSADSTVL